MKKLSYERHVPKYAGQEMVDFLVDTRFEDLPPEVVTRAKHIVLDAVSCYLAGRKTRELYGLTLDQFAVPGTVKPVGCKFTANAASAAFLNGIHGQTHDYNDGLNNSGLAGGAYHPGRVVVGTALAVGQEVHASGKELLTAVVLGIEVAGRMRNPAHHSTTADTYATAAVAAKLMGADKKQMRSAMALAGFHSPARRGKSTGYTNPARDGKTPAYTTNVLQYGYISRIGVESAQLAMLGYEGPGIDDNNNLSPRYGTTGLGKDYMCMNMYFKPWPCCRKTHGAIEAALTLHHEHGVKAEDIEKITVYQQVSGMYNNVPFNETHDICYAGQFSMQYLVAACFLDGDITLKHFRWPDRKAPQQYVDLGKKVRVVADNGLDGHNAISPNHGIVEVELKDGQVLSMYCQYPLGSEPNGMTEAQRFDKFRTCAEDLTAEDQDKAIAAIMALDTLERL